MMQRLPMFKDFVADASNVDRLYAGLGVDDNTIASITDYMSLMRIGDIPDRFIWHYRRTLMDCYPVYRDQLDAWAERKSKAWFFDNIGTNKVTHDGTFGLDSVTQNEVDTATKQIVKNLTKSSYNDKNSAESTGSTNRTGKDRVFGIAYPETNYQGGVVPYDLDNDPTIEFISNQSDHVDRMSENRSDETTTTTEGNSTSDLDGSTTGTIDTNSKNTVDQNTATHWTETRDVTAIPYNQLMTELIRDLPSTDFFAQFMRRLSVCFEVARTSDDYFAEMGGDLYVL